jgi:hypothetical protein
MADNIKKITETTEATSLEQTDVIPLVRTASDGTQEVYHAKALQFQGKAMTYDDMTDEQKADLASHFSKGITADIGESMTDDDQSTETREKGTLKDETEILYPLTHVKQVKVSSTKYLDTAISDIETSVKGKQDALTSDSVLGTINDTQLKYGGNIKVQGMSDEDKQNLNALMKSVFPTTMTISNNGSTSTLDKVKMVVSRTIDGSTTYPSTSITGTRTLTPYYGSASSISIATSDLGTSGNYKTYEHAVEYGKAVYYFKDATSGKSCSYTARHARTCYMWFGTAQTQTTVPSSGTYSMTPTQCQGSEGSSAGVTKSFSSNLSTDNYIYVAVPRGWTVSQIECKSAVTAVKIGVKQVATASSDNGYNIYVTTSTVRNISGNQIFVQQGSGSIN